MRINNSLGKIKLYLLIIVLSITQILINSSSKIYLDIMGILLIILLTNRAILFYQLILFSIIADLIGKWYLGTHLFSIILLSLISNKYFNFYNMLSYTNKNILVIIYAILQCVIISLIGVATNSSSFNLLNQLIELIIVCPCVLLLVNKLFNNTPESTFQ
jgi:hypothetical protein